MSRRTVLSTLGAALFAGSAGCSHPLPPPQGIVIQKGIYGERNNRAVPLLTVKNKNITVQNDLLATVFPREKLANTTVSNDKHERLKQQYEDIFYYVDIKKLNPNGPLIKTKDGTRPKVPVVGGTPRYILSREAFGKLLIEDRIEYTLSLSDRDVIAAITLIIRRGTIRKKWSASDSNSDAPPYRITVTHRKRPNGDPVAQTYFAQFDIYNKAQIGMSDYFGVVFKNRTQPTIQNFTPDPYGNL